jgi:hypothetical protein
MSQSKKFPRWAVSNYKGNVEDFYNWLREAAKEVFSEKLDKVADDEAALATVNAEVEHLVMTRTKDLNGLTERAFMFEMNKAQREAWYHNLPGEFDTVEDLLASMIDEETEGTTRWKNLTYAAEKIMPLAIQYGMEVQDTWQIPMNVSKIAEAVPGIRHVLEHSPEDEVKGQVISIIKKIVDPAISVRVLRDEIQEVRGKQTKTIAPMTVTHHHMAGGEEWYIVRAPTRAHARAAEIAVRSLTTEIDTRDPLDLAAELTGFLKKSAPVV